MLNYSKQDGVAIWSSPDGELRISKPAPNVLLTRFQGRSYEYEFAQHVMRAIDELGIRLEKSHVFHDWEGMQAYATRSRTEMTEQAIKNLKQMSFTVLNTSSIVKMGMAMTNFLMKGEIHVVSTRQAFDEALARALARKD